MGIRKFLKERREVRTQIREIGAGHEKFEGDSPQARRDLAFLKRAVAGPRAQQLRKVLQSASAFHSAEPDATRTRRK